MPGRCPSCNQTYTDESLTFCPNDGTPLVREAPGAYNQPPGMGGSQAPGGGYPPPPPQQGGGYYAGAPGAGGGQQPPPPPGWQQQPPYGQQQPPPPPYGQQYAPQYGTPTSSKMPLIIGLLALVLIGGGIGLYFLLRGDSSETANTNNNNGAVATSSPRVPSTTMTPSTTTTTNTTTGRTYTDDEKHKLFQAVGITKDNDLIIEVAQKIGIVDSRGNPKENFQTFVQEHYAWAQKNMAWVQDHLDASKAREYVMANK